MKIAMIGQKRIPSREGGVEIHVEELSLRLVEMGHEVTVYNRGKKGFPRNREYHGIRIVTVPTINRKSLDAPVYSFLAAVHALFGRYDVIHFHAEGPCAMLWLPHLFGIRTAATIHGLDWQRSKWGNLASNFLLLGEKCAVKYADELIVLSQNVRQYFKNTYGRETLLIPNGVNRPEIRKASLITQKYGLRQGCYLLFLARIVPEKGLHYLLRAFAEIDTEKKLVVAGMSSHSDGYTDFIRKTAAKDKRVVMAGFVRGPELDELFSNAFLYLLPSDVEGMPISLLEAMSCGCPCLVSDIPENTEVLGPFGYTFRKGDPEDLRQRICSILKEGPSAQKTVQARKYVLKHHDWDLVARETARSAYRNVKAEGEDTG
ncbi:glycosyltransferase family 4 protein [Caproicibacter sp.]|uniref:glycosyltransferase family 4 protein n=1 Tax=Caproicibacter sp. TaxID=2814884 RepID=UPI003988F830